MISDTSMNANQSRKNRAKDWLGIKPVGKSSNRKTNMHTSRDIRQINTWLETLGFVRHGRDLSIKVCFKVCSLELDEEFDCSLIAAPYINNLLRYLWNALNCNLGFKRNWLKWFWLQHNQKLSLNYSIFIQKKKN